MAEERMLNDEILLGLIKANSGGGGGGTSNYNLLDNLPQINGNTLTGNKSASDLDLVGAVDGKGLSTNDYTNADKAIVDGVTAALEGKQDALTAGNYISIANDGTINVTQGIGVYDVYSYEIKSINSGYATKITKRKNGVFESEQDISNGAYSSENRLNVDNRFEFWYTFAGYLWHYKLLVDSNEHQKDEEVSWEYSTLVDYTETFNVSQDSSTDLATKGDVNTAIAGKQDILTFDDTPTDNSNNPVKSNGIYDALALKQNATDNSLQTTDKTVVGAVNELKSGLTTLDNEVNGDATVYPYADVITIPDAVPANLADCNVKIEPVQDLHGFDKPWVGGAGDNKLDTSTTTISNITFTEGSDYYVTASPNNGDSRSWSYSSSQYKLKLPAGNWKLTIDIKVATTNQSNGVRIFDSSDNSLGSMLYLSSVGIGYTTFTLSEETEIGVMSKLYDAEVRFRITASTINEWSPYTNICPITGHTEASVQRDGKNLFNKATAVNNKTVGNDGAEKADSGCFCSDYISIKPNNTYYLSNVFGENWANAGCLYDSSKTFIRKFTISGSGSAVSGSYTVSDTNAAYIRINGMLTSIDEVQVELGSSATDYVPYSGKTYTIALGDTIYGGTVDFDSGVMTVDRAIVDLGSLDWTYQPGNMRFISSRITNCKIYAQPRIAPIKCSALTTITDGRPYEDVPDKCIYIADGFDGAYAHDSDYTDGALFKTAMNGVQLCYELATPLTIQLTPQQIQLLKGTNTLTASTGQISVTVNGVSGAIGSLTSDKQDKTDYALNTTAKTVVGGINELKNRVKVIEVTTSDTVDQGTTVQVPTGYDAAKAIIAGYTAQRTNNLWYNADDHVVVGMYSEYLYVVPKNVDVLEQTVKVVLIKFSA